MKSAQIHSQIFIYIFTIIIVSIILVYGYNAIANFRGRASQVSLLKFRNELTNSMLELSPEYGSYKAKEFQLPEKIRKLCFVETYDGNPVIAPADVLDPLLKDSVLTELQSIDSIIKIRNVFLIDNTVKESFNVPVKIDVEDGNPTGDVLCKEGIGGRITLIIKGKGDGVTICKGDVC